MSDTPRTDEQINGKPCTRFEVLAGDSLRNASVPSEFARKLERELNIELERANYYREMVLQSSRRHAQSEGGEAVSLEQRILTLSEFPDCNQSRELRAIALEVRKREDRIKQLEEELMDVKNEHAVLVADVVLRDDKIDRIKQLEDRIHRAASAFFRDGSDGHVASQMLQILEEERAKP